MKNACLRLVLFLFVVSALSFAASNDAQSPSVAGKWQFSWEARIGTERGTLQLQQTDSKLTGSYQGNIVAPKATGALEGNKITLNLDFQRDHPFTIIFTGTVEGDKMSGRFEVKDFKDAYDPHGENVRPSNYTWKAVRILDQTPGNLASQSASDKDHAGKSNVKTEAEHLWPIR